MRFITSINGSYPRQYDLQGTALMVTGMISGLRRFNLQDEEIDPIGEAECIIDAAARLALELTDALEDHDRTLDTVRSLLRECGHPKAQEALALLEGPAQESLAAAERTG